METTGGSFTEIATTGPGVTAYTDGGLADGTTYCYRVQAFNASGYSDYSNVACGMAAEVASLAVVKVGAGSGTVVSSPSGIDCGANCSGTFPSGTGVMLTPSADTGSVFSGWSGGGCRGTDACLVTLTSATTVVTASFSPAGMPSLNLALNKESYTTGETISATVTEGNAGDAPIVVDKYFGVLLPPSPSSPVPCPGGDGIVFLLPTVPTCLSLPATFMPSEPTVLLPAGLLVTTPSFFELEWPPAVSGTYVFFIAYTRPGTLQVIAAATRSVTFTP